MVLADLIAWRDSRMQPATLMHWRTATQDEVDFVLELPDGRLLAVECKTNPRPGYADAKGLRLFLTEYPAAIGGVLLHGGEETFWASERIIAAPWWRVL